MKLVTFILLLLAFAGVYYYYANQTDLYARPHIHLLQQIVDLFPRTKAEVELKASNAMKDVEAQLEPIYALKPAERTFANTMRAFDVVMERFNIVAASLYVLSMVSPDEEVRNAAHAANQQLQSFANNQFVYNRRLYAACAEYETLLTDPQYRCHEKLNDVERYFLSETMKDFRRNGIGLPDKEFERLKEISNKLVQHGLNFDRSIAQANRKIELSRDELKGVSQSFIDSLKKTEGGMYIVPMDVPTLQVILVECTVAEARKKMYKEFMQRGYPQNETELAALVSLRDEMAQLLGYASFAHYDIDNQMAKTPEKAHEFLTSLIKRAQDKTTIEMDRLKKELPEGVVLTAKGEFQPWDLMYVRALYKKKHFSIDELALAEYFPLDYTLPALLGIYEKFFGLLFKKLEAPEMWHKEVQFYAVYKGGAYLGTVLLDLFPRPNKYTHAAEACIVPSVRTVHGKLYPAVICVIANFPAAREDRPALLKRGDVVNFFHEFGHAIHDLLGGAELAALSGIRTKGDFVEMPSQMLEEWMFEPEILKMVSSHYKTKEPLPDELIEKLQAIKNFDSGEQTLRQLYYSLFCLELFKTGGQKNAYELWKQMHDYLLIHYAFDPDNHGYCAFTHLVGYGAKYYGYLWSKVFALDLFSYIKPYGLLDRTIGQRYVDEVIGKGGSQDPEKMLENFLGRKPNQEAFFKDLGW